MHEIELSHNNKRLYMPEHLGECNPDQFSQMCNLLYAYQNKKISLDALKYQAVYYLLEMEVSTKKLNTTEETQKQANILQLSALVSSFFEENENGNLQVKQDFRNNPMPSIPTTFGRLIGPADNFEGMPFGQYLDALDIFGNFFKYPEISLLYDLAATLYTPSKGYDPKLVKKQAKAMRKCYFGHIYGAYMLLATFQHKINTTVVMVEGNEIDLSVLFQKSQHKKITQYEGLGMKGTAFVLAESNVFGDYEKIRQQPMWDILIRLYDIRIRDLEEMAQAKKRETEMKQKTKKR